MNNGKEDLDQYLSKTTLRKLRNSAIYRLYSLSGMSYRQFAEFWVLDHSQLQRIVEERMTEELKRLEKKK